MEVEKHVRARARAAQASDIELAFQQILTPLAHCDHGFTGQTALRPLLHFRRPQQATCAARGDNIYARHVLARLTARLPAVSACKQPHTGFSHACPRPDLSLRLKVPNLHARGRR